MELCQASSHRDLSVDFAKGILIILMVAFHLPYFVSRQPACINDAVYSFHMPAFLIISGFFTASPDKGKRWKRLLRTIAVPYLVFETAYLLCLGAAGECLGAGNAFSLSFGNVVYHTLFHPMGTYWYLHTLIICSSSYFLLSSAKSPLGRFEYAAGAALLCYALSLIISGLDWFCCMYFFIGTFLRQFSQRLSDAIPPSCLSGLGFFLLCFASESFGKGTLCGLFLTLSALSFLQYVPTALRGGGVTVIAAVGRNTLCIVLFSPIFTIASKPFSHWFDFDPSGLLFGVLCTLSVIVLCLLCARCCDTLGLSPLLFGRQLFRHAPGNA